MRSDSVKNMSAYADQNHAPSLTDVRLEYSCRYYYCIIFRHPLQSFWCLGIISVGILKGKEEYDAVYLLSKMQYLQEGKEMVG